MQPLFDIVLSAAPWFIQPTPVDYKQTVPGKPASPEPACGYFFVYTKSSIDFSSLRCTLCGMRTPLATRERIDRYKVKLATAQEKLQRESQWLGVRLGAMAATKSAEREVNRIQREIDKLRFQEHNLGNCDPATCSDCDTYKHAPDLWLPRGANMEGARLTR